MKKITCTDQYGKKHLFYPHEFIKRDAVYGIHIFDTSILLVQDSKSYQWELPGGGKDGQETDFECLNREFIEETGLNLKNDIKFQEEFISYFYDVESQQPWRTLRKFYRVLVEKGDLIISGNNSDVIQTRYIPINDLSRISMNKKIYEVIMK